MRVLAVLIEASLRDASRRDSSRSRASSYRPSASSSRAREKLLELASETESWYGFYETLHEKILEALNAGEPGKVEDG